MRIHAPFTSAPASHAHKWGSCSRPWCVRPGGTGTAVAPPTRVSALPTAPLIKVCGVTRPEDAAHAAAEGANLVGMIMWPRAPRALTVEAAQAVAAAARSHGAEPVGVFVDEDAETIARCGYLPGWRTVERLAKSLVCLSPLPHVCCARASIILTQGGPAGEFLDCTTAWRCITARAGRHSLAPPGMCRIKGANLSLTCACLLCPFEGVSDCKESLP